MSEKRCAITGTAPTIRLVPWDDPTLEVWTLNDQYLLGIPRSDRHYDLHPFSHFFYRDPKQKKIDAADVPAGTYVRPIGHLDWLAKQSIPVYVQAADPRVPRGIVFPYAEMHARFDAVYPSGKIECSSTPQWMLMQAIHEGYTEIHIYGIHLETEWEYQKQRELFAFLIGYARGLGIRIVIPARSPLVKTSHEYAYAPDPMTPVMQLQRDGAKLKRERDRLRQQAAAAHWYTAGTREVAARVRWLDAQIADLDAQAGQRALALRLAG